MDPKIFEHGQKIFECGQKIFELADGTGMCVIYTPIWKQANLFGGEKDFERIQKYFTYVRKYLIVVKKYLN